MEKSYYKRLVLFEKFRVHHYSKYKIINRCEKFMIQKIKDTCINPISCTIELLKYDLNSTLERYMKENPSHGRCTFESIKEFSSIIGHPNYVEREFCLITNGRKIPTIIIYETVFKDSEKYFSVVPGDLLVYNKIETIS